MKNDFRRQAVEKTVILNQQTCGYTNFITIGKTIIAYGMKGGTKRLNKHIDRVIVVANNSKKQYGFLSRFGLANPEFMFDVDADIYLKDGSVIEIHSSEPKLLQKLVPYIEELHRNPRVRFYGDTYLQGGN